MATSTTTVRKSSVTNVNGISKSNNRGALSSTKSSTVLRTTSTPAAGATAAAKTVTSTAKTRTSTVSSIRSTATTSNKNIRLSGVSTTAGGVENRSISSSIINNNKTNSLTQRSRRIDSLSNLTVNSNTNASRSNLTDRSREPLSTQQTSRRNTRPPFSAGGRRISTGATSLASQNTAPSQLQRSKLSSPPTRASMPPATSTGLTSSRSYLRGASSATRQASTQRRGTSRGFMTPTTSSDAKQVRARECIRSVPNESPISSSPQCDTRRIYEPSPLGNSNKKPITTTFLRRGTSQNRGGGVGATGGTIRRKLSTDNIDQYSPSNKSSSRISDLTASVVAAIEAYDDPKAYLFYRMFQGSEETERTTNGIFQAFSSYSPNFQDLSPEMNSKPLVNMNNDDEVCPDAGADAGNERLLTTSQMKKHLSNDDSSIGRNKVNY
ncbi:unnamed protein product [Trichobilharzia regenti]|nr:unnamed protein product [Trichobilharzia regenti]